MPTIWVHLPHLATLSIRPDQLPAYLARFPEAVVVTDPWRKS